MKLINKLYKKKELYQSHLANVSYNSIIETKHIISLMKSEKDDKLDKSTFSTIKSFSN